MTAFEDLLRFVERETTFASSYYDDDYLDRRISARMRRCGTETYEAYLDVLRDDEDERAELLDTLSVNVTQFFRDTKVWTALRDVLLEAAEETRSLNVWSAACADGREPYSIAMLALDAGIPARRIDILATDIDEDALARARAGRYESTRTADIREQLDFLDDPGAYVDKDGDRGFVVADHVKDLVTFERHDLITDDPKSGFDVVACRNVCIYIDKQYKRPILDTVSASVKTGGHLVLGQTETLPGEVKERFEAADPRIRVYRRQPED
ncbi:CheR family methyltransferase [Halobacterium litoreum]|uniref:protein-glutamate O-methyltransferase n=1 Tax=Halobacterium litoreum TaxID=2039234 RepID=A0ABD5NAW6_9EURY|nr:protein-glutamate O-methyltransferase CheR [Halobacterium litoreum]UHH12013.1 protein-glutamate O-methyltransferase CheR [Halobacterium litoreum]